LIFGDAGSSWCKIFRLGEAEVTILPVQKMIKQSYHFDWGTGHTSRKRSDHFENDLISLTRGALALVDKADFTMLDLGSRDAKLVGFKNRRPVKLDWSVGCAAATGATMEMLGRFYEVDFDRLPPVEEWTTVTCGTYAVERIMDAIANGDSADHAISRFVHGLARHAHAFCGEPEVLYLSGGFTTNRAFMTALSRYTKVIPMGRTVHLAGLFAFARDNDPSLGEMPSALRPDGRIGK
jgi:activator of 2-hydroxyglutaryl-CoA dehydratase